MIMKRLAMLVVAGTGWAFAAQAQQRNTLAPYTAAAAQYKAVQLDRVLSAFRTGSLHEGLLTMADLYELDPFDADVKRLYRLNATRYAIRIAEDCDIEGEFAHCDTAIKYINLAFRLGDSSVYHEVRADALYQKVQKLELAEFTEYQDLMPARMLTRDMAYRYIPEERKIFFKGLIEATLGEISVARGDLDKRDKITELTAKLKVIERSQRMLGTR